MNTLQFKKILAQLADHDRRIHLLESANHPLKSKSTSGKDGIDSESLVLVIVNKIGECEESEDIQIKVLDQVDMEGKILLCFFISQKYFKNAWLNTGDIEKITSELGAKIAVGNVSNKIKDSLKQYLESGAVRKPGQPTPYRLNRKGVKRFNEIIHGSNK